MSFDLHEFISCPIRSTFIDTREDALSYYAHKFVGDHAIDVKGASLVVRFNPEEIHLFTDNREPCPDCDVLRREGKSGEVRCFSRQRARLMDQIHQTLRSASVIHQAKLPGGRVVYGPADKNAQRMAVVLGPGGGRVWFVRSAYAVNAAAYAQAVRSNRPAPWPPK